MNWRRARAAKSRVCGRGTGARRPHTRDVADMFPPTAIKWRTTSALLHSAATIIGVMPLCGGRHVDAAGAHARARAEPAYKRLHVIWVRVVVLDEADHRCHYAVAARHDEFVAIHAM